MKPISRATIVSLLLLLVISNTFARILPSQGDDEGTKPDEITKEEAEFSSLMGLEECGGKGEDCVQRRRIDEAHLDYIYTQHRPPHRP